MIVRVLHKTPFPANMSSWSKKNQQSRVGDGAAGAEADAERSGTRSQREAEAEAGGKHRPGGAEAGGRRKAGGKRGKGEARGDNGMRSYAKEGHVRRCRRLPTSTRLPAQPYSPVPPQEDPRGGPGHVDAWNLPVFPTGIP